MMKRLLLAALFLLPVGAYAASYTTSNYMENGVWTVGGTLNVSGTQNVSGTLAVTGDINTSGVTFSSDLTGNPLTQTHYEAITQAALNSVRTVLSSASGKSIYVGGGLTAYASGTLSGATAITLKCSGGSTIVSWPAALLTDGTVVGAFSSTAVTRGTALTSGCPSGEAIYASPTGTVATTTQFMVNLPYTVQ